MSVANFYCSRCSLQFDKKSIFDMHLFIVHKESIEINEDPMTGKGEPILGTENVLLNCDICSSKFETKIMLNKHINSHHEGNKSFKCEICDKTFSLKSALYRHFKSVHEEKKPFKCEICD